MITIEEAVRSNDILVGLMVLAMFLIAAAAWGIFVLNDVQQQKRIKNAIRHTEERMQKLYAEDRRELGADYFAARMVLKDELEKERLRRTEAEAERDAIAKKYEDLKRDAASCPAYGTAGKRGAF